MHPRTSELARECAYREQARSYIPHFTPDRSQVMAKYPRAKVFATPKQRTFMRSSS